MMYHKKKGYMSEPVEQLFIPCAVTCTLQPNVLKFCHLVFICPLFDREKGKGIHPLVQCAGFFFAVLQCCSWLCSPLSHSASGLEHTAQPPLAGCMGKHCWFLGRGYISLIGMLPVTPWSPWFNCPPSPLPPRFCGSFWWPWSPKGVTYSFA